MGDDSGARHADGVTHGNRAPVHVHFGGVQPHHAHVGQGDHRERFVQLPQVDVSQWEAGVLQRYGDGGGGGDGELGGLQRRVAEPQHFRHGGDPVVGGVLCRHKDHGTRPVVERWGVAGRHRPVVCAIKKNYLCLLKKYLYANIKQIDITNLCFMFV